jgi:hypothetical protein
MNELSWFWMGLEVTVPPVIAGLIAYPVWLKGESILGNVAGTIVIFGTAMALILREHVELDRAERACLVQGFICWPEPSAFMRFAIYGFIALVEVIVLFSVSLKVEARLRRRGYAPEWQ